MFAKAFLILSVLVLILFVMSNQQLQIRGYENKLRKKRSLIFPKGTVIQLVYCYLMSALGTDGILTVGATLGTNWDVPEDLEKIMYNNKMKILANRQHRRLLYPRIEYILNQLRIDGKSHIKKLLCDSKMKTESLLYNKTLEYPFIQEVIRAIFSYPQLMKDMITPADEYDDMINTCISNLKYNT